MQFGLLTLPREAGSFIEVIRAAERRRVDFVGVPDSQCLLNELCTTLGAAAMATDTVALGPSVTNPVTRHPTVVASAVCTLDDYADGRAVLGLASGDSAVYTIGERPATLAELAAFIELFRALSGGERAEHAGEPVDLTWLRRRGRAPDIPVMLAAEGPKTLRLAGRVADRVLVGLGVTPEVVERAVDHVRTGAVSADRDPDDVEVWVYARAALVDDRQPVAEPLENAVAASAHHALQFTLEGKAVPEEHATAVRRLVREYDSNQHVGLGDEPANRELMAQLGLTEYLTERFAIAGPPETWLDHLSRLRDTGLVDGVHLHPVHADPLEFIDRLGDAVIPAV